ncbi:MAG: hypothetical protein V4710_23595 [Verrucomicrobiota bacterium]
MNRPALLFSLVFLFTAAPFPAGIVPLARAVVVAFAKGDLVRLSRSEMLLFKGEDFLGAPKGQEFTVLKQEFAQVYVSFFKADGTQIALTLPADALESSPQDAWSDLLKAMEAFRDQRFEETRKLLTRTALDPQYRTVAGLLANRINGALLAVRQVEQGTAGRQGFATILQSLHETSEQLCKLGHLSLALPLEEGIDRLASQMTANVPAPAIPAPIAPPLANAAPLSKVDRADLLKRVTVSNRAVTRTRQAMAFNRLIEAAALIEEGLQAEPNRPELKTFEALVQKKIADSEEDYRLAEKFRTKQGGIVHALSALQDGLKRCADHPRLIALRREMSEALEERTAPPVTPAFLKAAGVSLSASKNLQEGHQLYTHRCTECHELEMLDSRSISGWQKMVAGMARRAHLNDTQQARVVEYLAAAQQSVESGGKE